MYGKNYNPYAKFPNKNSHLYEEEDYSDDKSEALEEEIDESYEPTDKEVREYAIETLGMSLPEDEGLLYLARDGLKAPLPPNWVPYQSRAGDVYYKHKITQEKTLEHPTDIEYRKKYEQMKEKAARKNLKSMNMKGSANLGISSSAVPTSMYGSKLNNSGLLPSTDSTSIIKLDPKIEQQYEEQYRRLEEKLRREWVQFQEQELNKHEAKMRRVRLDHESQIQKIYSSSGQASIEDKIKQDKIKIRRRIEEEQEDILRDQIKDLSKEIEQKYIEYANVYEEDNHLKLNKYQNQKNAQFEQKQRKYEQNLKKHEETLQMKKKGKQAALIQIKQDLENGKNREIEEATTQALEKELSDIKESYAAQIKEKGQQLDRQYNETKRILGYDPSSYLSELAAKKMRLKGISQQKIASIKKKQSQALLIKYDKYLDRAIISLKESLQSTFSKQLYQVRNRHDCKITKQKQKIDQETQRESENKLQGIYDEYKLKIKAYEAEMNQKISKLQEKMINEICSKSKIENKDIAQRLLLKQKENMIDSKSNMITQLKRQVVLQRTTFELIKFQNQITNCKNAAQVDDLLIKKAKKFDLRYIREQFIAHEQKYKQLCKRYRKDKQFLASVMNSLQNNNAMNKSSHSNIVKQYNEDVRIMRKNQQIINRVEQLLKKAEINDVKALEQLNEEEYQYHQPEMKKEIGSQLATPIYIQQFNEEILHPKKQSCLGRKNFQTVLKDQSRFLSIVRSELNHKLCQIRSSSYY